MNIHMRIFSTFFCGLFVHSFYASFSLNSNSNAIYDRVPDNTSFNAYEELNRNYRYSDDQKRIVDSEHILHPLFRMLVTYHQDVKLPFTRKLKKELFYGGRPKMFDAYHGLSPHLLNTLYCSNKSRYIRTDNVQRRDGFLSSAYGLYLKKGKPGDYFVTRADVLRYCDKPTIFHIGFERVKTDKHNLKILGDLYSNTLKLAEYLTYNDIDTINFYEDYSPKVHRDVALLFDINCNAPVVNIPLNCLAPMYGGVWHRPMRNLSGHVFDTLLIYPTPNGDLFVTTKNRLI